MGMVAKIDLNWAGLHVCPCDTWLKRYPFCICGIALSYTLFLVQLSHLHSHLLCIAALYLWKYELLAEGAFQGPEWET